MTSGGTPYLVFGSNKLTCIALPILWFDFAGLFGYSLALQIYVAMSEGLGQVVKFGPTPKEVKPCTC